MNDICLLSNNAVQTSPASQSELLNHYIRETSDTELEALAAHASFYLHRLDVQTGSGLAFVQAALLTAKYRRAAPGRPFQPDGVQVSSERHHPFAH